MRTGKDRGKRGRVIEARPSERQGPRREHQHRQAPPAPAADPELEPDGRPADHPGRHHREAGADAGVERDGRLPDVQDGRRASARDQGRSRARRVASASASAPTAARRSTSNGDHRRHLYAAAQGALRRRAPRAAEGGARPRSVMQVPRIPKITLNMGVGEAKTDAKQLDAAIDELTTIAGQRAQMRKARSRSRSSRSARACPSARR